MRTDPQHAPGGLSAAGRAILTQDVPEGLALTAQNLPRIRAETRAVYAPVADRAVKTAGVGVHEEKIADVPCLIVTPPTVQRTWPVLYGFGGGFITGSPSEDLIIAAPMAARTGARIIVPDYRLAPEHPWPAAVDDGFAVYRTLADAPFAVMGESAGGNLALALMARARAQGMALPGAAALLSPWCDLTHHGDSMTANDGRDPTLTLDWGRTAAGFYASGADLSDAGISPIHGDLSGLPPTIITTGTRDLLLSHAVRLSRVMIQAGVHVDLRVWDGLWHVFEFDDRLPEAAQSVSEIAAFVSTHMDTA